MYVGYSNYKFKLVQGGIEGHGWLPGVYGAFESLPSCPANLLSYLPA